MGVSPPGLKVRKVGNVPHSSNRKVRSSLEFQQRSQCLDRIFILKTLIFPHLPKMESESAPAGKNSLPVAEVNSPSPREALGKTRLPYGKA